MTLPERMAVAGMKGRQRVVHDALVFAAETFADQFLEFRHIQIEHLGDQSPERKCFCLCLWPCRRWLRPSGRKSGRRHDDTPFAIPASAPRGRNRTGQSALFQGIDVVLVGMLIKGQQHIGFIAGAQDFARANPHLENRRPAGNRRGNGHEGHDFLFAAARQAGQENRRWPECRPGSCPRYE